jgi:hypothetical protein
VVSRWRLLALDGTTLDVADTPANVAAFGRPGGGRGSGAFPQVRLVGLVECGTHAVLDAAMGGLHLGEGLAGARSPARPRFPPRRLARATQQAVAEALRHLLPPRRLRAWPRVVKRKMSNFALKRDFHRHWPQPTKSPGQAVVIVARTARGP